MSEIDLLWLGITKLCLVVLFASLYAAGGISGCGGKWVRRYLSTGLLTGGLIIFSIIGHTFQWWFLLLWPALILWACLPYTNNDGKGPWRRALTGIVIGGIGVGLALITHTVLGFGLYHALLCMGASVYLGSFNPVCSVYEQLLIPAISAICLPFMV